MHGRTSVVFLVRVNNKIQSWKIFLSNMQKCVRTSRTKIKRVHHLVNLFLDFFEISRTFTQNLPRSPWLWIFRCRFRKKIYKTIRNYYIRGAQKYGSAPFWKESELGKSLSWLKSWVGTNISWKIKWLGKNFQTHFFTNWDFFQLTFFSKGGALKVFEISRIDLNMRIKSSRREI